MNFKIYAACLLFTLMLFSCKSGEEDVTLEGIEINDADTTREMTNEISANKRESIIQNLQGKWKETEYPFRDAHFENSTVKFIEEGVAEEPVFQEYAISKECPLEVNNIKNVSVDDIFLVITETGICEILKVSNDTLILSGFNVSSNSDYQIVYKKVE